MDEAARPLLVDTGNGPTVFYRNVYLYSSKNPVGAAQRIVAESALLPATLIFIPSFGLGYGLPELLSRLPPRCHVLCVEHDPALMRLAEEQALSRYAGENRLTVIEATSLLPVAEALSRLPLDSFRRVVRLTLSGAARLSPDFYERAESLAAREIQTYWQNKMTLMHMGLLYAKNIVANLPLLNRAFDLAQLRLHKPLIVIGAGPSLPSTLPLIRHCRSRAALLAVDTALPTLLASGLVPDFVFALEPQFINIKDFGTLGGRPLPLIADLASAPQVIRLCLNKSKSPVYFFSSRYQPLALWDRLQGAGLLPRSIPPLGSVGVAAAYVALLMTAGPVFLAGLDFGFPIRRTHAPGSPADLWERARTVRLAPLGQREFAFFCERPPLVLAGKNGVKTESDLVLASYAQNLAAFLGGQTRVFDLNPHGLPLGAPLVSTAASADEVIAASAHGTGDQSVESRPATWTAEKVNAFLRNESRVLKEMLAVLTGVVRPERPDAQTLNDDETRVMRLADHASCHVPGKTILPEITKAHAVQVMLAGRFLLERLERAAGGPA